MTDLRLRLAGHADAAVIAGFNAQMARETEDRDLDPAVLQRGVDAVLEDSAKGFYVVAETEGVVAGQLMITYEWSDWRNGTFWWIQSVYVRKEYRSRGIFRSLYRFIEELARKRGDVCGLRLYVERHNERAKQAYRSMGMTETPYEVFETVFRA